MATDVAMYGQDVSNELRFEFEKNVTLQSDFQRDLKSINKLKPKSLGAPGQQPQAVSSTIAPPSTLMAQLLSLASC